jgi:ribosome recycling factor
MIDDYVEEATTKMKQSITHLQKELGKLRTGQASLALIEDLKVDYYGNPTPIAQVGTLGVPDSQTITIQPWDASVLKDIEKSIQASDLGLTPNNDGKLIRLVVPPLTGERRQQLVKILKKMVEESKVAARNVRRDYNDKIKGLEKESFSKDDCKKGQDKLQEKTDKIIAEMEKIGAAKEKDILDV